jgi:L-2-hydroxyglutarate oxidase LhgO
LEQVDCVVVGAGVIGLAVARELALAGREVVIVEAAEAIGTHTSSRNSEVIHAGIYYPQGSLKARMCVDGKRRLYEYCGSHGVPHRNCGKLIVATDEGQHAELEAIRRLAAGNGVDDLRWLTPAEVTEREPEIRCTRALWSPSTGIIDSHAFMLALLGDAEGAGAMLALMSPLARGKVTSEGIELEAGDTVIHARHLVNSAGLSAPDVARSIQGMPSGKVPEAHYAKGSYFTLSGRTPFNSLVYPVPEPGGLGVHVTLDMAGQARFGPDVEWIDGIDYRVDPARADRFYAAIRGYWPGLPDGSLQPGYAGIRPKLGGAGAPAADFVIQGPSVHGAAGLVNLFGIESPGLTASLALAQEVRKALLD